jgi:hypothetical protein
LNSFYNAIANAKTKGKLPFKGIFVLSFCLKLDELYGNWYFVELTLPSFESRNQPKDNPDNWQNPEK